MPRTTGSQPQRGGKQEGGHARLWHHQPARGEASRLARRRRKSYAVAESYGCARSDVQRGERLADPDIDCRVRIQGRSARAQCAGENRRATVRIERRVVLRTGQGQDSKPYLRQVVPVTTVPTFSVTRLPLVSIVPPLALRGQHHQGTGCHLRAHHGGGSGAAGAQTQRPADVDHGAEQDHRARFCDVAVDDPSNDAADVWGIQERFAMDWSQPPGRDSKWASYTLDSPPTTRRASSVSSNSDRIAARSGGAAFSREIAGGSAKSSGLQSGIGSEISKGIACVAIGRLSTIRNSDSNHANRRHSRSHRADRRPSAR